MIASIPLIAALFADRKHDEVVEEAQQRGIPIEAVKPASEVLVDEHLNARGAFVDVQLPSGRSGRMPHGLVEVDGRRVGYRGVARRVRHRAQLPDPTAATSDRRPPGFRAPPTPARCPGCGFSISAIIVVGGETGRLFADLGADVIKVESRAFPDGARAASAPARSAPTFVVGSPQQAQPGHRPAESEGSGRLSRLVAASDVVLSNFKPGTMDSLGLGFDELSAVNPAIVAVDSSAFGRTGPASRRMGYGPLVRARSGVTSLWRYPDDPDGFCDAITIYPDHTARPGRRGEPRSRH